MYLTKQGNFPEDMEAEQHFCEKLHSIIIINITAKWLQPSENYFSILLRVLGLFSV
jgi:hypothetical protein